MDDVLVLQQLRQLNFLKIAAAADFAPKNSRHLGVFPGTTNLNLMGLLSEVRGTTKITD
jgi:hypothetical protein